MALNDGSILTDIWLLGFSNKLSLIEGLNECYGEPVNTMGKALPPCEADQRALTWLQTRGQQQEDLGGGQVHLGKSALKQVVQMIICFSNY